MKNAKSRVRTRNRKRTGSRIARPQGGDQGIRKDQRGQEQPADKRRARENR